MVTLSGGPHGGQEVPGNGWSIGIERTIDGARYRRETQDQAVFTGYPD
jgi:hypothetical protein